MTTRTVALTAAGVVFALAATAPRSDAQPRPRSPKTGYDIAVVNLRSTGPDGVVPNAIVPTFKNLGTKTISVHLAFKYRVNGGGWLSGQSLSPPLAPGETHTITPRSIEAGFAKYGDEVEAFIDADNVLAEDNEKNNKMTKVLEKPAVMPRH